MHRLYLQANELTGVVIAAAIKVQKHFGPGLLESIYVKCLARELELAGCSVVMEKQVVVKYEGIVFDEKLRFDLLVNDCLIVEAKSTAKGIVEENCAQTLSYMSLLDIPLGLIINFGDIRMGVRGIRRLILRGANEQGQ